MRRILTNIISVIYTFLRFSIKRLFLRSRFNFSHIERFSPNVIVEIEKGGKMRLGKRVRAHSRCIFKVRRGGKLNIGDNVSFNYGCMITCRDEIIIDDGVEFGPNVIIYDHDHDVRCKGGIKQGLFNTKPIKIGKNVWIGCNTIILRGTVIGSGAVIGAGSIVKGIIPENSVFIQKR